MFVREGRSTVNVSTTLDIMLSLITVKDWCFNSNKLSLLVNAGKVQNFALRFKVIKGIANSLKLITKS